ncbi:LPS export ABC transporter periplasmic protein LptC [bacterium]|nr:LPS export ABC transporter periplasmic protein LptC [bacterium]
MGRIAHKRIAAITVVILALLAWAFRHYAPYSRQNIVRQPPAVVLEMEDVSLVGLGHDGKLWSAKAKKVEIGQNRSIAKLREIDSGRIYDGSKVVLKAKAGKAVYNASSRDLALSRGVEILGTDGQRVAGEGFVWNSAASSLRSMGGVSFQTDRCKASVDRLAVDMKSKELKMWNVNVKIKLNGTQNNPLEAQ